MKLQDGGPVFYKQARLTLDGREFTLYKFRSMIVDAESKCGAQLAQKNDARITPVGRFIRKVRLDELPQLINILRGDMSIVGPRPERPEIVSEYEDYIPEFRFRLKVKAGLTGYAQVLGKYNTTPYDKLKLDLMYIEKYSFLLDIKLILMTIKILFMPASTEGVDDATELTNSLANKS
ncbi:MAG: sugar transferase [Angelakisella sp.]